MGKEQSPVREWEQNAEAYLRLHYPPKRSWVNTNLEVLQRIKKRKDFESDYEVINWAIQTTEIFAERSGINVSDKMDTGVLHIPSRLAAIRRFESATNPLTKQLTLDKMIKIYTLAETTNVRRSIGFASSDKVTQDLENLTNLIKLHKEVTGL